MERRALITLALPDISIGGAEIVNTTLAKQFLSRDFRVDIVTAQDVEPKFPVPSGAQYVVLGARRTRDFLLPFAGYLRSHRPDALIASMWPFTTTCVLAHRLARSAARIAVCEHSTLSVQYANRGLVHGFMLKRSIALTYPLAHARVAVSGGVADDLAALSGIARDRFTVVHNPMTLPSNVDADSSAAEAAWGGWKGPRILTVGRLVSAKNHELLVKAFKQLLTIQDARLMILGTGEQAEIDRQLRPCGRRH